MCKSFSPVVTVEQITYLPRIKGSQVRVPVVPDHFISTCSPVQLDWFIKGWVVCGLSVIHAPKRHIGKRVGESPQFWASNSGWRQNHWASMAPNHSESRGISLVLGFQFWLKSESLGFNGTQPQWE
jgi:hypothetical protein